MDKYALVLDIVEHPEKYTSGQLAEIMSDPETKEIYSLLCKADSAIETGKEIDIDAEWKEFAEKHSVCSRRTFLWFSSRAASIVAIVCTSIVAVAAGIAVTVAVIDRKPEPSTDIVMDEPSVAAVSTDAIAVDSDSVNVSQTPVMFEDEHLETIMKEVADTYGVKEIRFSNPEVAKLHLYYKFDPALSLAEVVEQLNTFEQINIKQNGNILTID